MCLADVNIVNWSGWLTGLPSSYLIYWHLFHEVWQSEFMHHPLPQVLYIFIPWQTRRYKYSCIRIELLHVKLEPHPTSNICLYMPCPVIKSLGQFMYFHWQKLDKWVLHKQDAMISLNEANHIIYCYIWQHVYSTPITFSDISHNMTKFCQKLKMLICRTKRNWFRQEIDTECKGYWRRYILTGNRYCQKTTYQKKIFTIGNRFW